MNNNPCFLAISGVKNSGKTTLIEKLLPLLSASGLVVAVIKHDGHTFTPDTPGTDSFRFFAAGACATAVYDGEKYTVTRRVHTDESALAALFPEADLILLEGQKYSAYPKIELVRSGISAAPTCDKHTCLAYVSDLTLSVTQPIFSFTETQAIANFIAHYAKGDERR